MNTITEQGVGYVVENASLKCCWKLDFTREVPNKYFAINNKDFDVISQ